MSIDLEAEYVWKDTLEIISSDFIFNGGYQGWGAAHNVPSPTSCRRSRRDKSVLWFLLQSSFPWAGVNKMQKSHQPGNLKAKEKSFWNVVESHPSITEYNQRAGRLLLKWTLHKKISLFAQATQLVRSRASFGTQVILLLTATSLPAPWSCSPRTTIT